MAQRYTDGAELPYRITYRLGSKSTQELRFSTPDLAREEVEKLIRRGHSVNYDLWDPAGQRYITQHRYN